MDEGDESYFALLGPSLVEAEKEPCRARLTRHYWCVRRTLPQQGVKVTRIAYGLPMGGDIKYADHQTLRESLSHRVEA